MKLWRVNERDAADYNVGAQLHPEQVGTMVRVVKYDVPPPIVAPAVDQPHPVHRHAIAVIELNCGLAPVAPAAATGPRGVKSFRVGEHRAVDLQADVGHLVERSVRNEVKLGAFGDDGGTCAASCFIREFGFVVRG